jgi:hypothetical protein
MRNVAGQVVRFRTLADYGLAYPPPEGLQFVVCSPPSAANSAVANVAGVAEDGYIDWVGTVDAAWLEETGDRSIVDEINEELTSNMRRQDDTFGQLRLPGELSDVPHATILYKGVRPWVRVGTLENGHLLALPLNSARGDTREGLQFRIEAKHCPVPGMFDSHVELAHLWSFPPDIGPERPMRVRHAPTLDALITRAMMFFHQ